MMNSNKYVSTIVMASSIVGCASTGSNVGSLEYEPQPDCVPQWYIQPALPGKGARAVGRGESIHAAKIDALANAVSRNGGQVTQDCRDIEQRQSQNNKEQTHDSQHCETRMSNTVDVFDVQVSKKAVCGRWTYAEVSWFEGGLKQQIERLQNVPVPEATDPEKVPFWWYFSVRNVSLRWNEGAWLIGLGDSQQSISQKRLWQGTSWSGCRGEETMMIHHAGTPVQFVESGETLMLTLDSGERTRYASVFNLYADGRIAALLKNQPVSGLYHADLVVSTLPEEALTQEAYTVLFSDKPLEASAFTYEVLPAETGPLQSLIALANSPDLTSLCSAPLAIRAGTISSRLRN